MVRAVILDLDDTLYDERTYVLSGFRAVAQEIACRFPGRDAESLMADMVAELDTSGRGSVFNRALEQSGLEPDPALIADLVATYRGHRPNIALWPGVTDAIGEIARAHRTAIVTDGLAQMQRRKVEALGVGSMVEVILYCWEHEAPKPDPACYIEAARRLGAGPEETVVVGDRPDHDMAAARAAGFRSIRVMTGRYAGVGEGAFPSDATAPDFRRVPAILRGERFGATA